MSMEALAIIVIRLIGLQMLFESSEMFQDILLHRWLILNLWTVGPRELS